MRIMTTNCWGVSQGAQQHEYTCMGGEDKLRDSGKTIPFRGGGSLIFNLSLLTLGTDLAPTRQRITSEELILLVWAMDL